MPSSHRSSASLSHAPAHRAGQGAARQAKPVSDRNRIGGWLQRDEFIHCRVSQGHWSDADGLSPEPRL